jgi:hypothetical protein
VRVIVTGSQEWTDYPTIRHALLEITTGVRDAGGQPPTLIHGGAQGADKMAAQAARGYGWRIEEHRAHWRPYGIYNPHAGKARNLEMIRLGADLCLAFIKNGSHGATHCAEQADAAGIKTVIFRA